MPSISNAQTSINCKVIEKMGTTQGLATIVAYWISRFLHFNFVEWELQEDIEKMQYSQRTYLPWDVLSLEIHEYNTITLSYTQTLVASPGEAAKSWPYMSSHTAQGINCWFLIHAYEQNLKEEATFSNLWLTGIESKHGWFALSIFANHGSIMIVGVGERESFVIMQLSSFMAVHQRVIFEL
jgi:hypothetical protein